MYLNHKSLQDYRTDQNRKAVQRIYAARAAKERRDTINNWLGDVAKGRRLTDSLVGEQ